MNIGNTEMPEPILSVIICPFLSHRIRTLCFHNHSMISSSICLSLGWEAFALSESITIITALAVLVLYSDWSLCNVLGTDIYSLL